MQRPVITGLSVSFLLVLWLFAGGAPPLVAGSHGPLSGSLASNLLQARAQLRIYRHDDQLDLGCQSRAFVDADVATQPRVVNQSLDERKWVETWVLDRCGIEISYHVYFTEVGDGGAFFSFREVEWQNTPAAGGVNGAATPPTE